MNHWREWNTVTAKSDAFKQKHTKNQPWNWSQSKMKLWNHNYKLLIRVLSASKTFFFFFPIFFPMHFWFLIAHRGGSMSCSLVGGCSAAALCKQAIVRGCYCLIWSRHISPGTYLLFDFRAIITGVQFLRQISWVLGNISPTCVLAFCFSDRILSHLIGTGSRLR